MQTAKLVRFGISTSNILFVELLDGRAINEPVSKRQRKTRFRRSLDTPYSSRAKMFLKRLCDISKENSMLSFRVKQADVFSFGIISNKGYFHTLDL